MKGIVKNVEILGGHISLGQKETDVSIPVHSHIRHHNAVPRTSPFYEHVTGLYPAYINGRTLIVQGKGACVHHHILHVEQECLIGIIIRSLLNPRHLVSVH